MRRNFFRQLALEMIFRATALQCSICRRRYSSNFSASQRSSPKRRDRLRSGARVHHALIATER
jgi:hypothetical protein